jgi:hypothetical protein
VAVGLAVEPGDADPEADALADGFAFLVAVGDGVGGGENVAYS